MSGVSVVVQFGSISNVVKVRLRTKGLSPSDSLASLGAASPYTSAVVGVVRAWNSRCSAINIQSNHKEFRKSGLRTANFWPVEEVSKV